MMNKIGTKGILDDIEKETALRKLIVEYDENHNTKSKITYKDIYEFVKSQYDKDKVGFYHLFYNLLWHLNRRNTADYC